ncbi:MAG: hypothetical protein QXL15_04185 [Candidatus Korarchaeota archaeon]
MPLILVKTLMYNGESKSYYLPVKELKKAYPHVAAGDPVKFIILEVKNERNEVVKKFEIVKEKNLENERADNKGSLVLKFSTEELSELGIAQNYKIAIYILSVKDMFLFKHEIKAIGHEAEKLAQELTPFETELSAMCIPGLEEAARYLRDARRLYEQGKIENSRVNLRKAIESLKSFIPSIKPVPRKEDKNFVSMVDKLLDAYRSFVNYGGPHIGPTPRPTTEMVIEGIRSIIKMILENIEEKNIEVNASHKNSDMSSKKEENIEVDTSSHKKTGMKYHRKHHRKYKGRGRNRRKMFKEIKSKSMPMTSSCTHEQEFLKPNSDKRNNGGSNNN